MELGANFLFVVGLSGQQFEHFVGEVCGWGVDSTRGMVVVPVNKENEAKGTVVREEVKFDRKSFSLFSLLVFSAKMAGGGDDADVSNSRIRESHPKSLRATCMNDMR